MAGVVGWLLGFEEEEDEEYESGDESSPTEEGGRKKGRPSKSQIASANRIIQDLFDSSQRQAARIQELEEQLEAKDQTIERLNFIVALERSRKVEGVKALQQALQVFTNPAATQGFNNSAKAQQEEAMSDESYSLSPKSFSSQLASTLATLDYHEEEAKKSGKGFMPPTPPPSRNRSFVPLLEDDEEEEESEEETLVSQRALNRPLRMITSSGKTISSPIPKPRSVGDSIDGDLQLPSAAAANDDGDLQARAGVGLSVNTSRHQPQTRARRHSLNNPATPPPTPLSDNRDDDFFHGDNGLSEDLRAYLERQKNRLESQRELQEQSSGEPADI